MSGVLPEGRKPLPDEWFAERAQMQERIEELEEQRKKTYEALLKITRLHKSMTAACGEALDTLAELTGGKDE